MERVRRMEPLTPIAIQTSATGYERRASSAAAYKDWSVTSPVAARNLRQENQFHEQPTRTAAAGFARRLDAGRWWAGSGL